MPRKEYHVLSTHAKRENGAKKPPRLDFSYIFTALVQIAVALGAMAVVVYFGYHMLSTFSEPVTTAPAYTVTHSAYTNSTAYVIRDEAPIKSSLSSGFAVYRVDDGERVGKGEILCDVYSAAEEALREQMRALDAEIALLEGILSASATSGSITAVGESVSADYTALMSALGGGDLAAAAKLSDALRSSLSALAVLSGEAGGISTRLTELKTERAAALTMLGGSIGKVGAPSIGYFFSDCDGYEGVFTAELIEKFTAEAFYAAINASPSSDSYVGKIVNSPKWHVATPVSLAESENYSVGKTYRLTFPDNGGCSFEMTLEKLVLDNDGGAVLLFSSSDLPSDFTYLRAQQVRIEYQVFEGYRIPVEAVRRYDGMTGVYTLHGGYVYFRRINVLYEGEGFYVVSKFSSLPSDKPKTYKVVGFDPDGALDDFASLEAEAERLGLKETVYENGGTPVKYGYSLPYFYYLADLEEVILVGNDLYHGKVLN